MKKLKYIFLVCGVLLISCEEVIDLDLNDAEPKLVVETLILIPLEDNIITFPIIKLTTTASFFETEIPVVSDAEVSITDEEGNFYPFQYSENGLYYGEFIPQANTNYNLKIIYKNDIYSSTTQLVPVVPIQYIEQLNDGGFSGEDIELKAYFTDPAGVENYYFFQARSAKGITFDALSDTFFDGNLIFGFYLNEDLESGDIVSFSLSGIDKQNYNFLFTLLQQNGASSGPFETLPATVRGNIINETNPDNFPLGYFNISETSFFTYTVQ